jgi:SAM-dependent methyltransferase
MTSVRDPQSFDHLPARYDRFAELVEDELRTWLLFHLPRRPGGRAADLGCGTGLHTGLLAERFAEVLAADLSAPMVRHARQHRDHPAVRWEVRDLHEVTPGEDGLFDLVLSAYTLHHVPDFGVALRHLRSLLRPGGQLLLVDVVDERRNVPRVWFRGQAWRGFRDDVLRRRRPLGEAVELLRLQLDRDWLDHQSTDQVWPPAEWDEQCRAVYPGAVITSLHRARALAWRRPAASRN